ncbi:ABC transporter permease [Streptomyces sp. NPDC056244]|uniref:ABC transporter permease n=1 Tax=Streptomyces sp. NPDC056244 TaxID=3345762 RepID=UPI0035E22282
MRVLRAEWAKFWSLRSPWLTLVVSMVLLTGFGMMSASRYDPERGGGARFGGSSSDAVGVALGGQGFAQLAIGILGVLLTAGEYSTGTIRSTMVAVPRRLPVLYSKATVSAVVVFVGATAAAVASFLAGQSALAGTEIAGSLSDDGVLRALLGAGLYFALVVVIGVALGALIRSVAGGVAAVVVSLMLLPVLTDILPADLAEDVTPYLPSNAGGAIFALSHDSSTLSPSAGLVVFTAWVALAMAAAAYRLKRSDV